MNMQGVLSSWAGLHNQLVGSFNTAPGPSSSGMAFPLQDVTNRRQQFGFQSSQGKGLNCCQCGKSFNCCACSNQPPFACDGNLFHPMSSSSPSLDISSSTMQSTSQFPFLSNPGLKSSNGVPISSPYATNLSASIPSPGTYSKANFSSGSFAKPFLYPDNHSHQRYIQDPQSGVPPRQGRSVPDVLTSFHTRAPSALYPSPTPGSTLATSGYGHPHVPYTPDPDFVQNPSSSHITCASNPKSHPGHSESLISQSFRQVKDMSQPYLDSSQLFSNAGSSRSQGQLSSLHPCKTHKQNLGASDSGSAGLHPQQAFEAARFRGRSNSIPQAAALSKRGISTPEGFYSENAMCHFQSGSGQSLSGPGTSGYLPFEQRAATRTGRSFSFGDDAAPRNRVIHPALNQDVPGANIAPARDLQSLSADASSQQSFSFEYNGQQGTQTNIQEPKQGIGICQQSKSWSGLPCDDGILDANQNMGDFQCQLRVADQNKEISFEFDSAKLASYSDDVIRDALCNEDSNQAFDDIDTPSNQCEPAEFLNPSVLQDQSSGTTISVLALNPFQQPSNYCQVQPNTSNPGGTTPADQLSLLEPCGQAALKVTTSISTSLSGTCAILQQVESVNQPAGMPPQSTMPKQPTPDWGLGSSTQDSTSTKNQFQRPTLPCKTQTVGSASLPLGTRIGQVQEISQKVGTSGKKRKSTGEILQKVGTSGKRKDMEEDLQETRRNPEDWYAPKYLDLKELPNFSPREGLARCRGLLGYRVQQAKEIDDAKRRGREATASYPQLSEALSRPPLISTKDLTMVKAEGQAYPSTSR